MKIDLKNCLLFIRRHTNHNTAPGDGERGDFILVKFGDGNFTWNIRRGYNYELDRGKLDDVRKGDEEPMDISFGGKYEWVSSFPIEGDTNLVRGVYKNQLSIVEALRGKILDGESTHPWIGVEDNGDRDKAKIEREPWLAPDASQGACSPYCVALELHHDLRFECPDLDAPGEAYLFRYFRTESINADAKAGTITCSGRANILRPLVKNPYPTTSAMTPKWLYENGEDPNTPEGDEAMIPLPFLRGDSTNDPQTDQYWPRDRRDPAFPLI